MVLRMPLINKRISAGRNCNKIGKKGLFNIDLILLIAKRAN